MESKTNDNNTQVYGMNQQLSFLQSYPQQMRPQMQIKNQFITSVGHPLQTNWSFWYAQRNPSTFVTKESHRGQYGQTNAADSHQAYYEAKQTQKVFKKKDINYREKLKDLGQISTIEQFFQYFVFMKKPTEMAREIDLYFFREKEIPMWEESPNGGIWIIKVKKEDNIDVMWEALLLALIGEQFEEPKVIGLGLSLRTKERLLEIWIKDGRNDKIRNNVSNKLRHILQLDPVNVTLYFKEHQKSISDQSTMKNAEGFKFMKQKAKKDRGCEGLYREVGVNQQKCNDDQDNNNIYNSNAQQSQFKVKGNHQSQYPFSGIGAGQ